MNLSVHISKSHSFYPIHNVGFKDSLTHWLFGIKDHVLKFCLNIGPFCINKKRLDVNTRVISPTHEEKAFAKAKKLAKRDWTGPGSGPKCKTKSWCGENCGASPRN